MKPFQHLLKDPHRKVGADFEPLGNGAPLTLLAKRAAAHVEAHGSGSASVLDFYICFSTGFPGLRFYVVDCSGLRISGGACVF